jgi:hypothetical protein
MNERSPCPACGSRARLVGIELASQVTMRGSLRARARHGSSRPFLDQFVGSEYWQKAQRWVEKFRRIDREADRYDEVVTDPKSGAVVHEQHEPLSQHRGHGSARGR